jgi:hypothetical protein
MGFSVLDEGPTDRFGMSKRLEPTSVPPPMKFARPRGGAGPPLRTRSPVRAPFIEPEDPPLIEPEDPPIEPEDPPPLSKVGH